MPEPYNYLTNLPNPGQQMLAGIQSGMGMAQSAQQMRLAQEQADQMAMLRGAQMEQEQAQTAKIKYEMGLSQDRERAVADYFKRPAHERTVEAMEPILAMMPKDRADAMRAANEAKTKEQRMADVKSGVQTLSAVMSGDREAYERIIGSQMAAAENAGDYTRAQALTSALKLSPEAIELTIKANLASLGAEGKQALDNLSEVQKAQFEAQLQPEKLRKLKGEAQQEEVKGQYQEKLTKATIGKEQAAAAASIAGAENSRAAARLSLAKATTEDDTRAAKTDLLKAQAELARGKLQKAMGNPDDARQGALHGISVIDKLLDKKNLDNLDQVVGAIGKSKAGELKTGAFRPEWSMSESQLAVLADLETLGGQIFLQQAQKMRGLGQLTEQEGKKIVAAAGNISRTQGTDRLVNTLKEMRSVLSTAASRKPGAVPAGSLDIGGAETQQGGFQLGNGFTLLEGE